MSDLRYDLVAIREARTNKYDLMLKDLVSLEESSLAALLKVADYSVESIEFAEQFAERADAVYRQENRIVHVEFQTKSEADLSWRMLEYYVRIVVTHGRRAAPDELSVRQVILYIGTPRSAPHEGFETPNVDFRHEWRDVREFASSAVDLLRSRWPDDWLLGVLCMQNAHDDIWKAIAKRIPRSPLSPEAYRLARAKLLLIANLRRVREGLIKELIELSALFNVKDSNALRALADEILEQDNVLSLLRSIGRILENMDVPLTYEQQEELASFDRVSLENFLVAFMPTRNVAEAILSARFSGPRLG